MSSLVWILWPGSVFFTAVLSYRIGAYWSSEDTLGRDRAGVMPSDDPWNKKRVKYKTDQPIPPLPPPPIRWWSDEDDTEVLPLISGDDDWIT
ncbi:hypothetical protein AB0M45_33170 [Nocardia sp. NPDC051787]|uniref:hypothetical protein n=1 Tax=Nocardia sp. NPDC051787 TaxID=3155415 RepID=UPI003415DCF6